jgi:hypothetical protein
VPVSSAHGRLFPVLAAFVGLAVASFGVRADWLVLTDGTAFEIAGAPEHRGRMLVFRLPDGGLSSIRASDVDLEASQRRTSAEARREADAEIAAPRSSEPVERREAVLVLTDADVRHVSTRSAGAVVSGGEDADSGKGGEPSGQKLIVRRWGQNQSETGLTVFGVLENRDPNAATTIQLTILAVDGTGALVARESAALDSTTLLPGAATQFSALFDEWPPPTFDAIEFKVESVALKSGSGDEVRESSSDLESEPPPEP